MSGKRYGLSAPEPPPRAFDEAFGELNLTQEERQALVWHLAGIRARATIEALLPETKPEPWMLDIISR